MTTRLTVMTTPGGARGSRMMIDDFARYQRTRGFSLKTVQRRTSTLGLFARLLAPGTLETATHDDVENFLALRPAARTRHAYRSDLRVFYSWAVRRQLVERNPMEWVDPIKVPKSLPRPLHGDLAGLMLVGRLQTRRMVACGLYAGMRCAEIAALDGADVLVHADPPVIVVRNGKGGKDRVIPMSPELVGLLSGLPSGPVFANPSTGRPMKAKSVSAAIKRHLSACGMTGVPHQLRHTFGTELGRVAGGDLQAVADAMGHESLKTTQGYAAYDGGRAAGLIARMYKGGDAA